MCYNLFRLLEEKTVFRHVYIGCALREIPDGKEDDFFDEVERIRAAVRQAGFNVLDFIGLGDQDPGYVYKEDVWRIIQSHLMIAVCDYPSTGLGIEIGKAISYGKPVLAVSRRADVSKMITGAVKHERMVRFHHYKDVSEVVRELQRMERILFR